MRLRLPAAAGLLLALALPLFASAHEITNVDVDCEGEVIIVSGKLFGQDGGATVTVTGPDGYVESFFADQDEAWTVTLPLGPNGTYSIDWPDSGDFGPVEFPVDCVVGGVLPTEAPGIPTPAPGGAVLPEVGSPGGSNPTLPPTDTATASEPIRADIDDASLGLIGLAAAATWIGLTVIDRRARSRDRRRVR